MDSNNSADSGMHDIGYKGGSRAEVVVVAAVGVEVAGNDEFVAVVPTNAVGDSSMPVIPSDILLPPSVSVLRFVVLIGFAFPPPCDFFLAVSALVLLPFLVAFALARVACGLFVLP